MQVDPKRSPVIQAIGPYDAKDPDNDCTQHNIVKKKFSFPDDEGACIFQKNKIDDSNICNSPQIIPNSLPKWDMKGMYVAKYPKCCICKGDPQIKFNQFTIE